MPHLHLSYTANLNLDAPAVLRVLNRTLLDSGLFQEGDIKSRAQAFQHYLVGTADTHSAYVHIAVSLLSGRSEAVRAALAQQLLTTLQAHLTHTQQPVQLTVDVQEAQRAVYAKTFIK